MYPDGKKYFNNTWIECVSLFANSKTSPIYLQILVDIGTLKTEMSHKYGLQNSMLEESWIPSLCLCDIDFLPPSSLGFKNHSLKCKCFSPEGKKGSTWKLGQREVSQIFSTDIRNYTVAGSLCLSVCPYICCR